ncbi:MAG: discoidin domain-containing protein [Bifidobacterium bifidum]
MNIAWGNTYATNYSIQTSDDGSNWTDVKTGLKATAQAQWVKTTFDTPIKTRHIRMIATTKSQSWSLSVWEMRTMGTISAVATDPLSRLTRGRYMRNPLTERRLNLRRTPACP